MYPLITRSFPTWPAVLIKGVSLSASGILALADLTTTAKRTALTGTSTWWDIFVLVPGLHVQQRAEAIGTSHEGGKPEITSNAGGNKFQVTNSATTQYLQRIYKADRGDQVPITVDVGGSNWSESEHNRKAIGLRSKILSNKNLVRLNLSTFLYALGPAMTFVAMALMILAQDWWGLTLLVWLMVARALNVYIIQKRTAEIPEVSDAPNSHVCWRIDLDENQRICLRGLQHDLELITTGSWMRAQTHIEGYLEAGAKIIVYLVAVFSGNLTQMGDIILMALLVCSGGVLALSNSSATAFHMNGRTAYHHSSPKDAPTRFAPGQKDSSGASPTVEAGRESLKKGFDGKEARAVLRSTDLRVDDINYV